MRTDSLNVDLKKFASFVTSPQRIGFGNRSIYTRLLKVPLMLCLFAFGLLSSFNSNAQAACTGTITQAAEGTFTNGFTYEFTTDGNDVIINVELLDPQVGLVAFAQTYNPTFMETMMTNTGGQTFSVVFPNQVTGNSFNVAIKFAFAGGLATSNVLNFMVGDCPPTPPSTMCTGTVTSAAQGSFTNGFTYEFNTAGNGDVTINVNLLDPQVGLVAFAQTYNPNFAEQMMVSTGGQMFTITYPSQTIGATFNVAIKFAFAGGLVTSNVLNFIVGGACPIIAPTQPTTNSSEPICLPANVISIYSDSYPDIATNYNPNWGQSGFCCVNPNFNPGTGNLILAYPNFNYQGTELTPTNASSMGFFHVDVWTNANPSNTTLQVSPINFGTGTAEFLVTVPFVSGQWNTIVLPKSAFTGMTWDDIRQLKFAANGPGSSNPVDIYLDNIYFSATVCEPIADEPITNSPVPTCAPANVISIYSDTYTDIATNYDPNWGQSGHMQVNPNFNPGTGNFILAYPNFNYQGTELTPTDASSMEFLNVDVWTNADPSITTLRVSPINFGTGTAEFLVTVPFVQGQWSTLVLPKSAFSGMTWNDVRQLKFAANGPGSFTPVDIYLDNIYFSTSACNPVVNCPDSPVTQAAEGSFTDGFTYEFVTNQNGDVTINVELLDTKVGLVAFAQTYNPNFNEMMMTNTGGQSFSITYPSQTIGADFNVAIKFAFAGGLATSNTLNFIVGEDCPTVPMSNCPDSPVTQAAEGSFTNGFTYEFITNPNNSVTINVELLDPKVGLVAFAQTYNPNFNEMMMSNTGGQTFSITYPAQTIGADFNVAIKFAFAGGLATSNILNFTVGEDCPTPPVSDCPENPVTQAAEGSFTNGFTYEFITNANNSVTINVELLDPKVGLVAFAQTYNPNFNEMMMTNTGGQSFTITYPAQTVGADFNVAIKFAFAGGLATSNILNFTVGDDCPPAMMDECPSNPVTQAAEGSFTNGFTYEFITNPNNSVTINVELFDPKVGLVAFAQTYNPNFNEMMMTNIGGQSFSITYPAQTIGNSFNVAIKFAFAGGLATSNILNFTVGVDCPPISDEPVSPAMTPSCSSTSVISMYSNAYTNVPVDTWLTPWSQANLQDIIIMGNDVKKYTNVDFFGVETVGPNLLNVTSMQYLHLDFWTPSMTTVRVKLVDFGANGVFGGGDDSEHEVILNCNTQREWNSYHIPLSGFTGLKSKMRIAQLIISGLPTGQGTLFVDNVYFTNCAPVSPTVVAATISVTDNSGIAPNDAIICQGATATLTASGGGPFLWSSGAVTPAIQVTTAGTYVVTVTNAQGCTATLSQAVTVTPLPSLFTVTGGGTRCAVDNGLAITLSGSQTGVNYQLQLNGGNVGAPVAGTGAALNFPVQSTAGTYTVVATNATTGCTSNMTGNAVILVVNCDVSITDPCVCLNNATTPTNGQFSEMITVMAPAGQTWTVSAVSGLFTTTSPAPPVAPIAITVGTVLTASGGTYTLNGRHIDALGYTLSVTNNRGTTLTIGNSCSYPSPIISSPPAAVCLGTPYPLTGIPGDANIVSENFTVNGVAATTFNPTATGTYTIVYTVNGGIPKEFGPNDPGCIQSITQLVEVNPIPVITVQPVDTGVCDDGTAIFIVAATVTAPSTVSYQWQRQINGIWTNLAGQTGTTLTINNVTDADNNSRFRVIVSSENTNGVSCPIFSNVAWLYVHTSVSMTCNGHINFSLDENCGAENFANIFLSGPNSSFFYDVIFKLGNTVIPTSQVKNYIGRVLTYEVIDICDGNRCWGTVTFEDKLPPVLNCPCSAPPANVSTMTEIARTGSKIYYRSNGTYSWQAAYAHAQSIGGQMVSINNAQENALIKAGMDANYPAGWRVWIGLTDDESYGGSEANSNPTVGWVWTNGDPLTYTNWSAGEPNGINAGEDYVEMFASGMWNDNTNTSFIQGYILEVENCTFTCAEINSVFNSTLLTQNPNLATADACGPVTSTFVDQIIGDECDGQQIIRSWYVEDQSGNTATCQQFFHFRALTTDDVTFATAEVILNCNDGTTPAEIAAVLGASAAYPTVIVGGIPTALNSHVCNIYAAHTDTEIDACAPHCHGNKKVIRRWTILDWCEGTILESIQIIKAIDQEGPTFITKDTTVSTRPWDCTGEFFLPLPWELHDNCDANPTYVVSGPEGVIVTKVGNRWRASNVEKGIHTFTYTASDCCGNKGTETVTVTVLDKTPPIAIAKQDIVISLVPGYEADGSLNGQAKMFPGSVDNGSFDNCSDVKLEIRRPDGAPACGNDGNITNPATGARHNNNVTFSNSPLPGFNNNINDTDGGEFVKFCCADIPAGETFGIVEVELRVWDDGNMNGIIGDAGDNYNVTWANVRVEYKVPPQITCPPDMTIYCDWAIDDNPGTSDASAKSIEGFDFTKTGLPTAVSVCGTSDIRFWDRVQVNQCIIGTITRTFLVGTSGVKCVQTIKVDPSLASQPWTFIPSSLSETPIAIQSCEGPTAAQIQANAPRYTSGPCDNIGVSTDVKQFDFEQGVCRKWRVEFIYDNWCTDEKRGPFYKYFVYNDVVAPELTCQDTMFAVDNDCVAQVVLSKTAIDTSGCIQTGWLKWEVYVDLWADGTNDYLFTSFYAGADGAVRIIDGDAVRQYKLSGPTTNAGSDGATQSGQELRITLPDLIEGSMSNHKVVWKVTDGCHNYTSCHESFMVVDKKKPTPVCVPLSTALMADPDGNGPFLPMVELWAVDFMNKAYDNCTEDDKLLYTFDNVAPQVENKTVFGRVINIDVPHYFNAASGGVSAYPAISASEIAIRNQYLRGENGLQLWLPESRSSAKVWTSTSLDPTSPDGYTTVDLMVTVWDKKFNWDFCWTSLKMGLHDGPGTGSIAGRVATSEGKSVGSVIVSIDTNLPEFPIAATTPANGTYAFADLVEGLAYEIEASKGGSYSEGVSTLDLVLIQRHILGVQSLNDPYKLIAADANNDGVVTASDLIELRKLILGLTSTLNNNQSWRFAVAGTTVNVNPLSFEERINVNPLTGLMSGQDFVAIKIGDVNGNASTDVTNPTVESRSNNDVNLTIAERAVEAGETVAIPVTAANFNEVFGYQFTMNLNGASFVGVESGAIEMNANNVGVLSNDVVTMSFASNEAVSAKGDDVLFTMIVKANKAGNVSEMMALNSDVTATESYVGADLTVGKVSLNVRTADVAAAIELFQNEPNPFKGQTSVSFNMPSAAQASLSVYDVTGKLVTVRNIDAVKGYNSEVFTTAQLGTSGVLYYTLVSGDFTATKKMIIVE